MTCWRLSCRVLAAGLLLLAGAGMLAAQVSAEKDLPLDGSIAPNGRAVELRWFDADPPRVGGVTVKRRRLGSTGGQSWEALGPALGPVQQFTDTTTVPGIAYEYQVLRSARDIVDAGYWTTGVDLPAPLARGTVHLVVDETLAAPLAAHLARFRRDLLGDGWRVRQASAPRGGAKASRGNLEAAAAIRGWLQEHYRSDPFGTHAVVLVGHVPIPLSGRAAPDGHKPQPHASDLFYADMDGRWRADPEGLLFENSLPSDAIEMQVGRIDFSNVSAGEQALEVALLRAYFDKNHHWRMGFLGDPRQAYGQNENLTVERLALVNIVGPAAVAEGGHGDIRGRGPWLWGVDFGHHDGRTYAGSAAGRAVFAINFGSGKQKIEKPFNAMTALLAQPWYPLAVGWGGRPAWRLHPMALGESIGAVHMRTVNNGLAGDPYRETMDYFPTGKYLWRNPVWVNLLGDPTLRAFPLAPASRVVAEAHPEGVALSWVASPDPDTTGYRVFRAAQGSQDFLPLQADPQPGLGFVDTAPLPEAQYMVRAYGRKDVYAGSFHTYAQGAFSGPPLAAPALTIETRADTPVALPAAFDAPQGGLVHALIEGPAQGALERAGTGWRYVPARGFTGREQLRFSVSDAVRTVEGVLTVTVTVTD